MVSQIGRYRILSELGEGGFGKVYLAADPTLAERRVAIKVLTAPQDPAMRIRFKNEAIAAANLRHHPNVITILDYGEDQDRPFIVMEYLEGQDLSKRLKTGPPLTLFHKVSILSQIASGLYAAHSHSPAIIHRDVKPANAMLLPGGTVKIMDFGIARLADAGTRLTSANVLIGSVAYMAPEQFTAGTSDVQTDIWSFGVLAYELLAEQNPFNAKDVTQAMYQITSVEPTPLPALLPGCPPELAAVITKAMAKSRAQRYTSLEDTIFDLNSVRVSLRGSEADRILKRAEDLYRKGDVDSALKEVRQALDVDSESRNARALRDRLRAEVAQKAQKTELHQTVQRAEEALRSGDLEGAIHHLQLACYLDPADASLAGRLAQARAVRDARQYALQQIETGRRFLASGDLVSAGRALEAAIAQDSSAPGLPEFRAALDAALRQQAGARRRDQLLADSEAAYRAGDLQAAVAHLESALREWPGDGLLQARLNEYRSLISRVEQESAQLVASIRALLKQGQWGQARLLCLDAQQRFPANAGLQQLRHEIEQHEAGERAQSRASQSALEQQQSIQGYVIEIRRALSSEDLARAGEVVAQARQAFPQHAEFQQFETQIEQAKARRTSFQPRGGITLPTAPLPQPPPPEPGPALPSQVIPPPPRRSLALPITLAGVAVAALIVWFLLRPAPVVIDTTVDSKKGKTDQAVAGLSVSPFRLDFFADRNGPDPAPEQIVVRPAQPVTVDAPNWISVQQNQAADATILTVRVRRELIPADGKATLQIRGGEGRVQSVAIQAVLRDAPVRDTAKPTELRASPTDLTFAPSDAIRSVRITGVSTANLKIAPDQPWIVATRAGASDLDISTKRDGLSPGRHTGNVALESRDNSSLKASLRITVDIPARVDNTKTNTNTTTNTGTTTNTNTGTTTGTNPVVPDQPAVKTGRRWTGGLEGTLRLRQPLKPGESFDLTSATANVDGSRDFPWLYETNVQVRVTSPASVSIEAQPGRANSWNVVRLRNGAQATQLVILEWAIH